MATTRALPPPLDVVAFGHQVGARLAAIETEALPALALRRAYLERTWRTGDAEGVPVFTASAEAIVTHSAGIDRLACVLADQEGLSHEASALRELALGLDLWPTSSRVATTTCLSESSTSATGSVS